MEWCDVPQSALLPRGRRLRYGLCLIPLLLSSCGAVPAQTTHSGTAASAQHAPPTSAPASVAAVSATPTTLPTAAPTHAPTIPLPSATTLLSQAEREQIFNEVWQLVNDKYVYSDFHDVDWLGNYDMYFARAQNAQTNDAFYGVVAEMVDLLNDQHSRFVPPAAVVLEDSIAGGRDDSVGIGVATIPANDGAFVQFVFPDSPASRADIRPRDRIIAVNGRPYMPEDGNLQGEPDTKVRLNVVRPGDKPRDVVLVRQEVQGRIVPTYRRFPGNIGYLWVSTLWVNDMDEQVSGALTELAAAGKLDGMIIDLRGNQGGWRHVLSGILSHFVRGQVGTFYDRYTTEPLMISAPPGPDLRGLPLVVLIDGETASYAEVLAAILQQEANATVVGTPSAGNTETIYAYTLKDNSRLWLAQEGFRLPDNTNLEGTGVQPDTVMEVNWKRYSEEDDPQLLEALRLLGGGPK